MLRPLLAAMRKYPLLKLLLCAHVGVLTVLVAYYYTQAGTLWDSKLYMPVGRNAETGEMLYQVIARGPSLLLPWNLLPQDVFWLGLDVLVFGTLAMCLAHGIVKDELRGRVAGREKEAADKLREAGERSAAADRRMRDAQAWERMLEAREARMAEREAKAARRRGGRPCVRRGQGRRSRQDERGAGAAEGGGRRPAEGSQAAARRLGQAAELRGEYRARLRGRVRPPLPFNPAS